MSTSNFYRIVMVRGTTDLNSQDVLFVILFTEEGDRIFGIDLVFHSRSRTDYLVFHATHKTFVTSFNYTDMSTFLNTFFAFLT